MLKKPKIGQVVVTKSKCSCCVSRLMEGNVVTIKWIAPPVRKDISILVDSRLGDRWYCTKCLRRPKKGETL